MKNTKPANTRNKRRELLTGALGVSALGMVLPAKWSSPLIKSVVTPAHAQTSMCPVALTGNVDFGPVSGSFTPPVCLATFDVLSGDPAEALDIISITDNNTNADVEITYDGFGEATDTAGPRVVWRGPASDAPFCTDLMPIDDITFTVTFTCAGAPVTEFTQDFLLSAILA